MVQRAYEVRSFISIPFAYNTVVRAKIYDNATLTIHFFPANIPNNISPTSISVHTTVVATTGGTVIYQLLPIRWKVLLLIAVCLKGAKVIHFIRHTSPARPGIDFALVRPEHIASIPVLLLFLIVDADVYTSRTCTFTCCRRDSIRTKGAKLDAARLRHATSRAAATAILD